MRETGAPRAEEQEPLGDGVCGEPGEDGVRIVQRAYVQNIDRCDESGVPVSEPALNLLAPLKAEGLGEPLLYAAIVNHVASLEVTDLVRQSRIR